MDRIKASWARSLLWGLVLSLIEHPINEIPRAPDVMQGIDLEVCASPDPATPPDAKTWRATVVEETFTVPLPRPEYFTTFRADWGGRYRVILVRLILAVYMTVWLALSVVGTSGEVVLPNVIMGPLNLGWKWVIYLTNWSLALLVVYLWSAWVAAVVGHRSPTYGRIVWVLRNINAMAALCVSSLFWTILFPQIKKTSIVDVHCHGINTVAVLLDLAISPLPYFLKHGYQGLLYMVLYLFFSVVYWDAGETDPDGNPYIYPPLNYEHPGQVTGLVLAVVFLLIPLLHTGLWLWARAFERLAAKRLRRLDEEIRSTNSNDLDRPML